MEIQAKDKTLIEELAINGDSTQIFCRPEFIKKE
jgi:hypothetical protein